jgi:hypothetical protein
MIPPTAKPESCSHRERLVSQFQRSLDCYHQAQAASLDKFPVEEDVKTMWDAYEACEKARRELYAHEAEHGCLGAHESQGRLWPGS